MAILKLQNPHTIETIKVEENCKRISDMLDWVEQGNMQFLKLHQIEPKDMMVTISPKNFAKIDYYDEVDND